MVRRPFIRRHGRNLGPPSKQRYLLQSLCPFRTVFQLFRFFSRKANHLRDKQQHQIACRLPEETPSHGHPCRSRACLLPPPTFISPSCNSTRMSNQPIALKKNTGRSLRLRLQRRNLHIPHPPPPPIQTHRLRPRRIRYRARTRL